VTVLFSSSTITRTLNAGFSVRRLPSPIDSATAAEVAAAAEDDEQADCLMRSSSTNDGISGGRLGCDRRFAVDVDTHGTSGFIDCPMGG
jgi:hypothetical protein